MSRYIDADRLLLELYDLIDEFSELDENGLHNERWCGIMDSKGIIVNAPSIDIVFCKECRHSFINENHPQKPRICGLTKMCGPTKDDWFCADGEREDE